MNNNTPSHPLLIKTFTWEKDSNELIDYESSSLRTTSYTTQSEGAFYRYDNKVVFTNKDNSAITNGHCYLSSIKINEGNYYYQSTQKDVFTSEFSCLDNLSWLVFKGKKYPYKNQKYLLTEGEILKIGRIWLYVREIHLNTSMNKKDNDDGWGYTFVTSDDAFIEDYRRVLMALKQSEVLVGFCYTQITDVEQEINGLLTYDRKPKVDLKIIKEINDQLGRQVLKHKK